MKEHIAKLINVKSVVTILLTLIFGVLALRRDISSSEFLTVFTPVITIVIYYSEKAWNVRYSREDEGICQ